MSDCQERRTLYIAGDGRAAAGIGIARRSGADNNLRREATGYEWQMTIARRFAPDAAPAREQGGHAKATGKVISCFTQKVQYNESTFEKAGAVLVRPVDCPGLRHGL
jgi:hypothetical protein